MQYFLILYDKECVQTYPGVRLVHDVGSESRAIESVNVFV